MKHRSVHVSLREVVWLIFCAALLAAAFLFGGPDRVALSSAETQFVELSASGLQIVPASCPSNPHDGGSCSGHQCNINFTPSPVAQGTNSTLSWSVGDFASIGSNFRLSYPGGSHEVASSGNGNVGGDQTKTYTLSYTLSNSDGGTTPVSCSATLTVCPPGQTVQNGQCVSSGGSCTIAFSPRFVAAGGSSNLSWNAPGSGTATLSYPGGSQTVNRTGSAPVGTESAGQTKTYTLSGSGFTQCQATLTACPSGQIPNTSGTACVPAGQCQMSWSPAYVNPGNSSTLTWTIPGPGTISYPGGSFPVTQSGSGGADGGQSDKTYSFSNGAGITCAATLHVCPTGTVANAAGTACVPTGQCLNINFCIGNSVYRGDPQQGPPQCPRTHIENCVTRGPGWTCSGGACVPPPSPTVEITASPSLVKSGDTSTITWTSQNTESCTVSENNPDITDAWNTRSGTETSGQLTMQTRYTATCLGLDGTEISDSVIVNVIPSWQEI